MTKGQERMFIRIHAILLSSEESAEKRLEWIDEFAKSAGLSIPDWPERLKEELRGRENSGAAIETVNQFCAQNHIEDENGVVFFRKLYGNKHHYLTITFDRNKPDGEQFSVEEYPDLDSLSLSELQKYYSELEDTLAEEESEEPEEADEEEYNRWQDRCDDLEELMDEVEERICKLEKQEKSQLAE